MTLATDKFLIPDGAPSGGFQKMKSVSVGLGSIAETNAFQLLALATQQTPPGAADKFIVWDNAAQNTADKLFVNHTGRDSKSYQQLLEIVDLVDSQIVLVDIKLPTRYQIWNIDTITPQTGYTEVEVTLVIDNGGNFADNAEIAVRISRPDEVIHDGTLTGKGTNASPLAVVPGGAAPARIVAFVEEADNVTTVAAPGYHDIDVTLADDGNSVDFTVANNNQIKYTGAPMKNFMATLNFSGEKEGGGAGQACDFSLFKNGTTKLNGKQSQIMLSAQRSNVSTRQKVTLATNDYVVARLNNQTGNNDIENQDLTVTLQEF